MHSSLLLGQQPLRRNLPPDRHFIEQGELLLEGTVLYTMLRKAHRPHPRATRRTEVAVAGVRAAQRPAHRHVVTLLVVAGPVNVVHGHTGIRDHCEHIEYGSGSLARPLQRGIVVGDAGMAEIEPLAYLVEHAPIPDLVVGRADQVLDIGAGARREGLRRVLADHPLRVAEGQRQRAESKLLARLLLDEMSIRRQIAAQRLLASK